MFDDTMAGAIAAKVYNYLCMSRSGRHFVEVCKL